MFWNPVIPCTCSSMLEAWRNMAEHVTTADKKGFSIVIGFKIV